MNGNFFSVKHDIQINSELTNFLTLINKEFEIEV